jgi:CRP/FNR family transcriptional regulator
MNQDSFVADWKLFHALDMRSTSVDCKENQVLFNQGDPAEGLFIIRDGEASLVILSRTDDIIFSFCAGPDSVLGVPAVVGSQPYSLTATVRKGSNVGFVERDEFNDLLRKDPSLYPSVLKLLAGELNDVRKAIASHLSRPASQGTSTLTILSQP